MPVYNENTPIDGAKTHIIVGYAKIQKHLNLFKIYCRYTNATALENFPGKRMFASLPENKLLRGILIYKITVTISYIAI